MICKCPDLAAGTRKTQSSIEGFPQREHFFQLAFISSQAIRYEAP
jgi:hypothetical protein